MARPTLKKGDRNDAVKLMQERLNLHGHNAGRPDGAFGKMGESAVMSFQKTHGLEATGVCDIHTWAALMKDPPKTGMEPSTPIHSGTTKLDRAWNNYGGLLAVLAAQLGVHPAGAVAVLMAESGGAGMRDGRMVIRFENHVFYRKWGKLSAENKTRFAAHFVYSKTKVWKGHAWREDPTGPWSSFHGTQDREYDVLSFARFLDDEAALLSISMGAPQMMGFNHNAVGHTSARSMFDEWSKGEEPQIRGMFSFIEGNSKRLRALQSEDWVTFAKYYNGSGQAEHYGSKISQYVGQAKKAGVG